MRPPIEDQFTHLPVSRQRKWQLRRNAEGKCVICGKPQVMPFFCLKHVIDRREYERTRDGFVGRKTSCPSYRLEAAAQGGGR